jgi:hypothetical protein
MLRMKIGRYSAMQELLTRLSGVCHKVRILGTCAAITTCASCSPTVETLNRDPAMAEIRLLQTADPAVALNEALKRGDHRFLGIMRFGLDTPGVDDLDPNYIAAQGVREVYGGGDAVSDDRNELILRASEFESKYNQLLLKVLQHNSTTHPTPRR